MLRVSIHEETGQVLGERYGFEFTPTYIVFDGKGNERWRGNSVPSVDVVLGNK